MGVQWFGTLKRLEGLGGLTYLDLHSLVVGVSRTLPYPDAIKSTIQNLTGAPLTYCFAGLYPTFSGS